MFDDHNNNSSQDTDDSATPTLGLGINPNPSFVAPTTNDPTPPPTTPIDEVAHAVDAGNTHASVTAGNLEEIKLQALSDLSPLVGKLEQSPEERYKTIMMLIQASDNQDLISEAYTAAQQISDEKVKAEALLNIVNEINYFTQHQHNNQ